MERGRPSLYTHEIGEEICRRLASGESLRSICRSEGMPDERTVRTWALENETFSPQYAKARDIGMDAMADEIVEIADNGSNDWMERHHGEDVAWVTNGEAMGRSRLRVDTRKWLLSKIAPKRYGDRVTTALVGADGGPIETRDVSDLEKVREIAFALAKAAREQRS